MSKPHAAAAVGALVRDPGALLETLRRMRVLNEAVMFRNQEDSLKLMLRNDPVGQDSLACDLCIVTDDDDESLARMLDLHPDGYVEDPTTYVLESWSFSCDEVSSADLERVAAAVNAAYLLRICSCKRYLIKDDAEYCYFCQLTSTAEDRERHFCPICCDEGVRMHMVLTGCCCQPLHRRCLDTWHAKSGNGSCPLCRRV